MAHISETLGLITGYYNDFTRTGERNDIDRAIELAEGLATEGLAASVAHDDMARRLDNLCSLLGRRFQRFEEVEDIEKAITRAQEALEITPRGQLNWAARLSSMAISYYHRYTRLGALGDLEKAIQMTEQALQELEATPEDHPTYLTNKKDLGNILRNNLGNYLGDRYRRLGALEDLERAIERTEQLLESTPLDHSSRATWLNNLGNYLSNRYQQLGTIEDLEKAIERSEQALEATGIDDPKRAIWLNSLGSHLDDRYERLGALGDLENAIKWTRESLELTPIDHPDRAGWLSNLGKLLSDRYQRLGNLGDLEEAIQRGEQALEATPEDHPSRAIWLSNLGDHLCDRYQRMGALGDLEQAIERSKQAVEATPENHPSRITWMNNLGGYLSDRYERLGSLEDLEEAIELGERVLDATPVNHPGLAMRLGNLGNYLANRYDRLGALEDLQKSIKLGEQALQETPEDHPEWPTRLDNLSNSLSDRYQSLSTMEDLEMAIKRSEQALEATPKNHPGRAMRLNNLGSHISDRYERLGTLEDLEKAIDYNTQALETTPEDHPNRVTLLNSLGRHLRDRYKRLGALEDLEEAIIKCRQVLEATPAGHSDHPDRLQTLSDRLSERFERLGAFEDIEKAIELSEQALEATPVGHPDRARKLGNLGNIYNSRYERLGTLEDLEKTIELSQQALGLTQVNESSWACRVNNLGNALSERHLKLGAFEDIQNAIGLAQQALDATPANHPEHAEYLSNLSTHLYGRYQRLQSCEDLKKAIELSEKALEETPEDHPIRPTRLSVLGCNLSERYLLLGDLEDFEAATTLSVLALMEIPEDHPDRGYWMNTLGSQFIDKYQRLGNLEDLEEAITWYERGLKALPPGHPQNPELLANLGTWITERPSPAFRDLYYNLGINLEAWNIRESQPSLRISAARRAARIYSTLNCWRESSSILDDAIRLLPTVCPRDLPLGDQQHRLLDFTELASEAFSAALQAGQAASHCLRLLELSRGIIMSLVIDCRSSLTQLQKQYPDIYNRLSLIRAQIDSPTELSKPNPIKPFLHRSKFTDQTHHRRQREKDIIEFEELLASIRNLPDFDGFLLPPAAEDLIAIASEGPIIFLNSTKIRSDAIIITNSSIKALPLPRLLFDDAKQWMEQLRTNLIHGKNRTYPSRNTRVRELLLWLWDVAVGPILEELQLQPVATDLDLPRVWWIGVGLLNMAPFHAAGDHSPGSTQNTFCRVISSYIPTIKALSYARERRLELLNRNSKFLLVTMPETPKYSPLSSASEEASTVISIVQDGGTTELLNSPNAAQVLEKLKHCDAVHFACHGVSDGKDPSRSHLLLCKERKVDKLTVGAISRAQRTAHAQLAYLSACSTARNDSEYLIDESLHIASAFQLAGFSHVLATLWKSNDHACLQVSSEFYELLFGGESASGGHQKVSMAFHKAVKKLRNENWRQPLLWASFIHTGA